MFNCSVSYAVISERTACSRTPKLKMEEKATDLTLPGEKGKNENSMLGKKGNCFNATAVVFNVGSLKC